MSEQTLSTVGESILGLIQRMLQSDKSVVSEGVTIYTSFGIVRGRITRSSLPLPGEMDLPPDLLHPHTPTCLKSRT